jgi:hypothetical protein
MCHRRKAIGSTEAFASADHSPFVREADRGAQRFKVRFSRVNRTNTAPTRRPARAGGGLGVVFDAGGGELKREFNKSPLKFELLMEKATSAPSARSRRQ